uniref:Uncharacterized protein n=1 Tax=Anopheles melas TaxID=34690 RepID=A0A182U993_9DIPT
MKTVPVATSTLGMVKNKRLSSSSPSTPVTGEGSGLVLGDVGTVGAILHHHVDGVAEAAVELAGLVSVEVTVVGGVGVALLDVRVLHNLVGRLLMSLRGDELLQTDDGGDDQGNLADDERLTGDDGDRVVDHGQDTSLDSHCSEEWSEVFLHLLAAFLDQTAGFLLAGGEHTRHVQLELVSVHEALGPLEQQLVDLGRGQLSQVVFAERRLVQSAGARFATVRLLHDRHTVDQLDAWQLDRPVGQLEGLHLDAL